MNVLLTSAGRRNYLIGYFQDALRGTGEVVVTDMDPCAPAMHEADRAYVAPRVDDPGYFDFLEKLCLENDIRLLLSLNDLELSHLSKQRERFEQLGVRVVVSSPDVIDICSDKIATYAFLTKHSFATPEIYTSLDEIQEGMDRGQLSFPLIIKARWGSGSIGLRKVDSLEELSDAFHSSTRTVRDSILSGMALADKGPLVVIQPCIDGDEYHLDIINDLHGQWHATLVKRKIAMRSGETDRAVSERNERLEEVGKRIGMQMRHVGNLDCDLLACPQGDFIIDLNPRFGGGYPFSHAAGANVPAALLSWAEDTSHDPADLQIISGIMSAKCSYLVSFSIDKDVMSRAKGVV